MYDLAINLATGDLIFSPHRDLLGASGEGLVKQRVLIRCEIPRGTWIYDEAGTLGSNLHKISSSPSAAQVAAAPSLVREALAPMLDMQVVDSDVQITDDNRLLVNVSLRPIDNPDDQIEISEAVDVTVAV